MPAVVAAAVVAAARPTRPRPTPSGSGGAPVGRRDSSRHRDGIENRGEAGTINPLGVEVDSSEAVHGEIARLAGEGLFTEEQINTTCCFATQDKVWVGAPDGERWEVYTVLADSDTFGEAPALAAEGSDLGLTQASQGSSTCCTPSSASC